MKFVHKFEEIFGGAILAIMAIITFLAAINRFTLHLPMPWSEEIVKFLVMWMTMVGAALGIGRNEHVGIDVLIDRMPPKLQLIINQVMNLTGVTFAGAFCYIGYLMVIKQYAQKSTALEISMGIVYACIIIGSILMFVEFGYRFISNFKKLQKKLGGEE